MRSHLLVWLGLGLVVVAAACGDKKPDCGALSTHVAEVSTRDEDPQLKQELYGKLRSSTDQLCSDGAYKAEQIACLLKADAKAAINHCLGLPDLDPPPPADVKPVPPPPPKAKPTFEQMAPTFARYLTDVSQQLDAPFTHGCLEGFGRMGDVFDKLASAPPYSDLFRAARADAALNAALQAAIRDKTDPGIAGGLAKLAAKASQCKDADAKMQQEALSALK